MVSSQLLVIFFTVSNIIFNLNAEYVGKPQITADNKAILKQSFQLKCEYTGNDGDGEFVEWYKDDIAVSTEKPGHYIVQQNETESILIIKIFVKFDADVKVWQVKTKKNGNEAPSQCRFGQIALKPSPQGIETNRPNEKIDSAHGSIRRSEDKLVHLTCIIEPKQDNQNEINIEWEYSKDGETFSDLPPGINKEANRLVIEQVKKIHNGYYRCLLNGVPFTVLLRVKDRLAALWPFIGIVSVVLVLVIVILIFEKRQKSNKKTSTDDDEQDQANDPLVRTTTNTSENDNKKRAVNA
ncbi:unnamed protein product [Rotaria sordida]|uniref:Ig-like domain-containing protein n=1 Tax=Rotaria sordida TaxID=392033 RepID=A0A815I6G7_9BILA|nr:unnamed protein product [Rotaria sordida]